MATAKILRARRSRSLKSFRRRSQPDFGAVLGSFAAALSLTETVANALEAAEDRGKAASVASEISALRQSVDSLRRIYNQLDLAIVQLDSDRQR